MSKETINTWRIFVAQNKVEQIFNDINNKVLDKSLKEEWKTLSARFQSWKALENHSEAALEIGNQITISILDLIRKIEVHQLDKLQKDVKYSAYCKYLSATLYEDEITNNLENLKGWNVESIKKPNKNNQKDSALIKTYQFNSFLDVIDFMSIAARYLEQINHHPHWDNTWRNLTIRLSSWDIGHRVSALDFEAACYLEGLFERQFNKK